MSCAPDVPIDELDAPGSSDERARMSDPSPEAHSAGRAEGFASLAPSMGEPLDPAQGTPLSPPAPRGWTWYQIEGAVCRDGTPAGFFVRYGRTNKLLWYLEHGGACFTPGFCSYNPKNVDESFGGDGQTLLGSLGGAVQRRQQPGTDGIFSVSDRDNPFRDWSQIFVPYCTGDVHFGTRPDAAVPGVPGKQQFVGHLNMLKFASRIVPTFQGKIDRVVLAGSSAGGFGATLNYSMVQDAFGDVPVVLLNDSGPPMADDYLAPCLQRRWRELWGFDDALPSECTTCRQPGGGGLGTVLEFLAKKHPGFQSGLISSERDELIRLFFSPGRSDCARYDRADPVLNFLVGIVPGDAYHAGLEDLRRRYVGSGRFATYFMAGIKHQHLWRPRFFHEPRGGVSVARWVTDFLSGKLTQVAP